MKSQILLFLSDGDAIASLLVVAAIAIGLFFLLRAVMLWYWKIDEIVLNQTRQTNLLRHLLKHHIGEDEFNKLMNQQSPPSKTKVNP